MAKLYRFEAKRYAVCVCPESEIYTSSSPRLKLEEYKITGETPKGYWIGFHAGHRWKWVSKTGKKRFAYPSVSEAFDAYVYRKEAFVKHSKNRLQRAQEDLALVEDRKVLQKYD